jgi:biopolymer transport protein ExbD
MKATTGNENGKYRIVAEINMIPFIDIALVLLIIFMVMTPFLIRSQIRVNLPEASAGETQADKQALHVQVDRDGRIIIDGNDVPMAGVESALRRLLRDPARQPVVVEADRDVPFQHVVDVLDAGKKIGAARLGVCVRQTSEAQPGNE